MFRSEVTELNKIPFPSFCEEKAYMVPFFKNKKLPSELKRWQPTIDAMLDNIDHDGEMFLMIDQDNVSKGVSHRREGKHIDGYWIKDLKCHGGGGHIGSWDSGGGWSNCDFKEHEAILLASDIYGCDAYTGKFDGKVSDGGDCENIDISMMDKVKLSPNKAYIGNVTMIHESVPVIDDCERSLVRINIPKYYH